MLNKKQRTEIAMNPTENLDVSVDETKEEKDDTVKDTRDDAVVTKSIPRIGQRIRFLQRESDEGETVTIHSHAGKSTGKYCNWKNIKHDDGSLSALNWNKSVEKWMPLHNEDGV